MRRCVVVAMVVVLMLLAAVELEAALVLVGVQGGYEKTRDADTGSFMGGAAVRVHLPLPILKLGAEASVQYRQDEFGAITVKSWPVMVTGLWYPLSIVYAGVGVGWFNTTFDYDESQFAPNTVQDETKQEFGWHFGGGLEIPVGPVTITGDIRYVFLNYDFETIPGTDSVNSDFYVITGGILFRLF